MGERAQRKPPKFGDTGEVYSYTTIYHPPAGLENQMPYVVALVETDGPNGMVTARMTDLGNNEPRIGMKVEFVIRRLSDEGPGGTAVYGTAARPKM